MKKLLFCYVLLFLPNVCLFCFENQILEAKDKLIKSQNKHHSINLKDPLENHKSMIAAYFSNNGCVILDVGAYHGEYTLFYSGLVGEDGYVIGYEASPYIYKYLYNRITHLNIKNIILKERAVSNSSNQNIAMNVYEDIGPACCTVEPCLMYEERMPGHTKKINVITVRLDDVDEKFKSKIKLVKIDVEGHEHAVIEGGKGLFLSQRPLVIFEYATVPGIIEPKTIQQMEDLNYSCYDLMNNKKVNPEYSCALTDILAIPSEIENDVISVLPFLYY